MRGGYIFLLNFIPVTLIVALFVSTTLSLSCDDVSSKQYFDLSYPIDNETIYFPGQRQYELYKDYEQEERNGYM